MRCFHFAVVIATLCMLSGCQSSSMYLEDSTKSKHIYVCENDIFCLRGNYDVVRATSDFPVSYRTKETEYVPTQHHLLRQDYYGTADVAK